MQRSPGICAAALLLVALCLATGCSPSGSSTSAEGTSTPPAAVRPDPPQLDSPMTAVESYTDWISYAYRVLDSDVATRAFSVYEEVNVNSYVQLLKTERLQAIEQSLEDSDYRLVSQTGTSAVVAGSEEWRYRYIDIKTGTYDGPENEASYEVTYTLVVEPSKGWVVDRVDAVSPTEVE